MAGLSINEMTTYRWSFEEDVTRYKAAGIEAIGVWRQKLADCGEDKGIKLLDESGLAVSNLLWAGGFTGSDGHSYQESLADAREAIHLAAALAADCLVVYSGGRNGHTQNHARRLFASALDELLPLAEKMDVALAVEPMHAGCADEWTLLTSLDEATSLIHKVGSRHLKLAFDTYHLGYDPGIVDEIAKVAPFIGIVHLGDGRCPPDREQNRYCLGEGNLPLARIVKALRQSGYDGYYDVELIGEAIENCDYQQLLDRSKRAFDELIAN
ncbi:MAG: sugar phosphate isomerase/epimerase family protein [Pirellulales bacterium]